MQQQSDHLEQIINKLHFISNALQSLGAILEQQVTNPYYEKNELNGLGEILKYFSQELCLIEEMLQSEKN